MQQMQEILSAVITGLVAVIATLTAFLRFYLPRHDKAWHNPYEKDLTANLEGVVSRLDILSKMAEERHGELLRALGRIEAKLGR